MEISCSTSNTSKEERGGFLAVNCGRIIIFITIGWNVSLARVTRLGFEKRICLPETNIVRGNETRAQRYFT